MKVWQKSHDLTLEMYKATRTFPKEELYGLTSQVRRSAAGIAATIAEACGKSSYPEINRFVQIALGSASETQYHLLLARDLGYIKPSDWKRFDAAVIEIKRMLTGFSKYLRQSSKEAGDQATDD